MQTQATAQSDEQAETEERSYSTCGECGGRIYLGDQIGAYPLLIQACEGCGVLIEYDPNFEDGGPCPICPALEGKEPSDGFVHTHAVEVEVFGGKTSANGLDLEGIVERW